MIRTKETSNLTYLGLFPLGKSSRGKGRGIRLNTKIIVQKNQLEEIEGITADYPYVMHRVDIAATKVPWHWHEEMEIGYIEEGSAEILTANKTCCLEKGDAYFTNTNALTAMRCKEGSSCTIVISHIFHPVILSGHFRSVFEKKYVEPVLKNKNIEMIEIKGISSRQKEIVRRLRHLTDLQAEENKEFQTRNLLSDIWLLLIEEIREAEETGISVKLISRERIQTMMAYIKQYYAEKITLDEIAASAPVSKRECLRCFRDVIQKTPIEYLMDYRIEMAEKLLKSTDKPITEIALETGFSNSAYFGKVFKNIKAMTPGEYRKQNR